ncbi:MAG: hypothetical protein IPP07_16245 [Holophagales bacterium]|nr:hypothetical protein [Holophagales bacterium]
MRSAWSCTDEPRQRSRCSERTAVGETDPAARATVEILDLEPFEAVRRKTKSPSTSGVNAGSRAVAGPRLAVEPLSIRSGSQRHSVAVCGEVPSRRSAPTGPAGASIVATSARAGTPSRRTWSVASVTSTLPSAPTAIPRRSLKRAEGPVPSTEMRSPTGTHGEVSSCASPAAVVTSPAAVTLRTVPAPLSTTQSVPSESRAIPTGSRKRASHLVPSRAPGTLAVPATVVTDPSGPTFRIVPFPCSST